MHKRNFIKRITGVLTSSAREQCIGLYIASLAVLLAIANMGGSEANALAASSNINATNIWAWFQGKKGRRVQYQLAVIERENELLRSPDMSPAVRERIKRQISDFHSIIINYDSEPGLPAVPPTKDNPGRPATDGEGLKELAERAMEHTFIRDRATRQGDYFDYAEAFLQIAIVSASIGIIMSGNLSLFISVILASTSLLCMANGFFDLTTFSPILVLVLVGLLLMMIANDDQLTFGTLKLGQARDQGRARRTQRRRPNPRHDKNDAA